MKKICFYLVAVCTVSGMASCTKSFLQKPNTTGNTTIETIFSNRTSAEGAVAAAYRAALVANLWDGRSINNGTITGLSGEVAYGESWGSLKRFVDAGFSAPYPNTETNRANSTDNLFDNYAAIRRSYLIKENIDKVADMDGATKTAVKGEMSALIAYRYTHMFIRYGGMPIVGNSLTSEDNLNIPRASLQRTLDTIVAMCDDAVSKLPNSWDAVYAGRLTKGFALATKARALTYAARPLFNSSTPYLSSAANNLICFGSADQNRWQAAITANEAVITWATQNGYGLINTGGGAGVPNPNALDDYGNATSTPNNREVIQAYKLDEWGNKFFKFYNPTTTTYSPQGNGERYLIDHYGMLSNFLTNYYKADGTDQTWPGQGTTNALPYADYNTKMQAMEARFKADNYAHGIDAWNNPGSTPWTYANCSSGSNHNGAYGKGVAQSTKFYYKAGTRGWFEFPIFRIAEIYLNLAEAYNEVGNSAKALQNLNIVHNRAGLPSITTTDPNTLRKIIQREWAVEFYNENKRFFDVKHWKLADIGNGIIGGQMREFQFTLVAGQTNDRLPQNLLNYYDQVTYSAYWNARMFLDPIPQEEIDKGILVQNPGY